MLQQLQEDLLALLQQVVIPQLRPGEVLKEPGLSAVSRIIKGRPQQLIDKGIFSSSCMHLIGQVSDVCFRYGSCATAALKAVAYSSS